MRSGESASERGQAAGSAQVARASAPAAEQATRFASALALRWLEIGATSYQDYMLSLALVLFALTILGTARVNRLIGFLMGVSGLAFFVLGWVVGTTGFTSATFWPRAVGYLLLVASMLWLYIIAWLGKESVQAAPA